MAMLIFERPENASHAAFQNREWGNGESREYETNLG